jgi:hypothetical protein
MKPAALALSLALLPIAATAQDAVAPAPVRSTDVPHLPGEIRVDGVLDEPFWQQAAQFELALETRPGENIPASVRTVVRIADGGQSLRVAFEAEDPDPAQIRAFLRDRDAAWNDDFVGMNLDTFDNQRRAYEFYVNPLGAQMDLIYEESNGNEDASWDGFWDSVGRIHERGYTVEIEIPYSTMRFQHQQGPQRWRADFVRFRPREHRFRYSNNLLDRNSRCYLCGLGALQGFAHADPGRNLEVSPTLTMQAAQSQPSPGAGFGDTRRELEFGADVQWSPTPNLTLNGTLNPDFSQVEVDGAQLDVNTTFALFFPEKRPFFLEGADYFSTDWSLVYTRTVADPDAGLRLTGRSGAHTYGVFAAHDAVTNLLRPGVLGSSLTRLAGESDDLAARYRYDFENNRSLGAILTWRRGEDYENRLLGFDGRWQQGGHSLTGLVLQTRTEDAGGLSVDPFDGYAYRFGYEYVDREQNYYFFHESLDDGFRADLGFMSRVDYRKTVLGAGHTWYGGEGDFFHQVRLRGDADITHRNSDGQLLEREYEIQLNGNGPLQSYLELFGYTRDRYWAGRLFPEHSLGFFGEFTPRAGLRLWGYVGSGQSIDFANDRRGRFLTIEPGIALDLGRGFSLELNHVDQRLQRGGGTVYHAQLSDLRVGWQFDLRQRLRLSLQRSTLERDPALHVDPVERYSRSIGTQLIYSYKLNPRTVFYAGYGDAYYGEDGFATFQTDRTLFVKLGYAWQP